jgi:hypothetical protein
LWGLIVKNRIDLGGCSKRFRWLRGTQSFVDTSMET